MDGYSSPPRTDHDPVNRALPHLPSRLHERDANNLINTHTADSAWTGASGSVRCGVHEPVETLRNQFSDRNFNAGPWGPSPLLASAR